MRQKVDSLDIRNDLSIPPTKPSGRGPRDSLKVATKPIGRNAPKKAEAEDTREGLLYKLAHSEVSSRRGADYYIPHRVLEREMNWLKDPRALADRVVEILKSQDPMLAVALIRRAHYMDISTVVAYNRLLEYCLRMKAPKAAFRFWNDMKKRGVSPNSRSYTTMLDGLAQDFPKERVKPVEIALKIYRSLSESSSRVEPNIIHTNAMLKVCWHHRDMDILWQVAGELPENGPLAPDTYTYATILRAISDVTLSNTAAMGEQNLEAILERRAQGIKEGKRIWSDVVYQWKKGRLALDNHLVDAMAHLLVYNSSCDHDIWEVFALYNQTTGLPIFAEEPPKERKRLYSRTRQESSAIKRRHTEEDIPFVDEGERLWENKSEILEQEEAEEENFDGLFDAVVESGDSSTAENSSEKGKSAPSYLPVKNVELSMLLQACMTMTQGAGAGKSYWRYLTQEEHSHSVKPDGPSYYQYLRLLRYSRSSRDAVQLIRDMMEPNGLAEGKAFHIAMSCCSRDRRNPNVFKYANELLDIMRKALVMPDARALKGYFDLVRSLEKNPQFLMTLNGLDSGDNTKQTDLSALGNRLKASLLTTAAENLRWHVSKLESAVDNSVQPNQRMQKRLSQAAEFSPHVVTLGEHALIAMTEMRRLLDSIKKDFARYVSSDDLAEFEKQAVELRKYSKQTVTKTMRKSLIGASPGMRMDFNTETPMLPETR
ncbi:hypothetical protein BO94DRAFT_468017 [Aspergillus sclerotioniger CBS 115572]|uniref:Pentatricopeptide repeat protein n=1 Tax=Aspergillus sclerotioniger CBS 115572 TaxID=1450535 RepID=A0A317WHB7_9EURO|nr:hypothetical protein BO94DRAFT_468017 [Aspergillus sclerotioniger CBS 115572]PWY84652.1 hypothetical protein BO94DRAFT_468017 [Aspergillus sclerotioniger CBS 115572]